MIKPEILSPAGSREALEAAVRSGADAVYLGATSFSARRNAANFDEQALAEAVAYCHARNVRVHLTLNIMLRQYELSEALAVARSAVRAGIDAVIVADLGLCRLLHKAFPELELHASTQMSVHSPSALPMLKKLGIRRVVAAREMSRDALKDLCAAARMLDMSVEVFIHGALCMCVSGQCLMSAVLGGRSGNRGLCAGPCRLPFAAPNGTGYDLSLKDLSLLPYLKELAEMGVESFKIEGRMKRPEYVAAATAAARSALDSGVVSPALEQALGEVFSRSGFTDGYYTDRKGLSMFGVRTKDDVTAAPHAFGFLHELYRNERQSVALTGVVQIAAEKPISMTVSDGTNTVTVTGEMPQAARVASLGESAVRAALEKLGGTPYYFKSLSVSVEAGLFLRGAELNALRRDAVKKITALRSVVAERRENAVSFDTEQYANTASPKIYLRVASKEQLPQDLSGIKAVFLPLECDLPENLPSDVAWGVDLPRGMVNETAFSARLQIARGRGYTLAYCGNSAQIPLAKKCGFQVISGIGLNVANPKTAAVLKDAGVSAVTLSPELLLKDAVDLPSPLPKGIFAYGRLPLMLTRNCPVANGRSCAECDRNATLCDRKGMEFPVRCRDGFAEVLNALPLYLADRLSETAGLDYLLLYCTDESPETVAKIVDDYKNGGVADRQYTRGLYYRGVQ
ncbi:MAG: U32 family peptidase [Clostridia bacterium]|nr:U32 family peptidase [Clostridia bacterium]